MINDISVKFKFLEIFPVSAKKSFNTPELLESIIKYLPKGEFYFEKDIVASQSERFFVAEIVRAEVMNLCRDEIPFSVFVEIEEFNERKNGKTYIRLNLILDKESHKKIIVGKEGSMIKRIGSHSRKNVEEFLGEEVYLDIFVKVKKNWKDDDNFLRSYFKRHALIS
jgi:GTP-binding protein Era